MTFKSVEGVYRKGKVELSEMPGDVPDETKVIVTFLAAAPIRLADRGISETQAAELRTRLQTFSEDWDRADMDVYDNYDARKQMIS